MKELVLTTESNEMLAPGVYRMILSGSCDEDHAPGRFINIKIDGLFLRRPISVADYGDGKTVIIYKTVGKGTEKLKNAVKGDTFSVLTGLGNGYDLSVSGDRPLLLGGGVGIPPLYGLAKRLVLKGKQVTAILGFNDGKEVFYEKEFEALGVKTVVTTVNGSYGTKGFVTDAIPSDYTHFYCCGPEPMLRAVYKSTVTSGQFSFEERMGCGFGACMGCSCKTVTGYKRICKDGPVLFKEEILWEK